METTDAVETYTDAMGREQLRAVGPRGTVLITRKDRFDIYQVWWSDSIRTILRTRNREQAIRAATGLVNS